MIKLPLRFRYITLLILIVISAPEICAQEHAEQEEKHETRAVGSHAIFAGIAHTYIQKNKLENADSGVAVATWSLAYSYRISEQWGAGLQSELLLESFVIQSSDGTEIEREYPVNIAPVAIFQPIDHLSFFGGFGFEIAPEETIRFTRLGAEYAIPMKNNWELAFTGIWDWKINVYNSWGIGVIFGKIFGGKSNKPAD